MLIIQFQLDKLEYEITMGRKVVDIDDYLPFHTIDEMVAFCNPEDHLLNAKKAAFKERLYASGDMTSMANFVNGIVNAVFHSSLLGTHKWPYKK